MRPAHSKRPRRAAPARRLDENRPKMAVVEGDRTTPAGRLALVSAVLCHPRPRLALLALSRRDPDAFALVGEDRQVVYDRAPEVCP